MSEPIRLRLINANTTVSITEAMVARSQSRLPAGYQIDGLTATYGEAYISSRPASTIAAHAVVDLCRVIAAEDQPSDAVVLACFGDPGLWAAREILDCPVIGMAEASCLSACQLGQKFSIVTGGRAWGAMLAEFVHAAGLAGRLASIVTAEFTGADVAAGREHFVEQLGALVDQAIERDDADVVILGGAGLVGLAEMIGPGRAVPVLDSLSCALAQAVAVTSALQMHR